MGHHENRTGKMFQYRLQNFLGHNIQMVGWFVQEKEIGFFSRQDSQRHAAAFATTQATNYLMHIIPTKQKLSQVITRLTNGQILKTEQLIQNRVIRI